jgi:hypothetical protein
VPREWSARTPSTATLLQSILSAAARDSSPHSPSGGSRAVRAGKHSCNLFPQHLVARPPRSRINERPHELFVPPGAHVTVACETVGGSDAGTQLTQDNNPTSPGGSSWIPVRKAERLWGPGNGSGYATTVRLHSLSSVCHRPAALFVPLRTVHSEFLKS